MSLLDNPGVQQPSPAMAAQRIRRTLAGTVGQMEQSLAMVRECMRRHGRKAIIQEMGNDADELIEVYKTLKKCIKKIDANREIDELPK